MTPRIQVTFDCWNVHVLAGWWAVRLDYEIEDVHEVVQQLLDQGVLSPDDITTVNGRLAFATASAANDPSGAGPRLYFQAVTETKTAKNRVHLDLHQPGRDLDDVVAEYVGSGATFTTYGEHPGNRWAVMADPEGNEFCLQ